MRSGEAAKSEAKAKREDRKEAAGASERTKKRDTAKTDDDGKTGKRAHDAAESKARGDHDASSGASEGAAGSDTHREGSVTQLSGEKRTKVQSAFRSHRSGAVVKDIDIHVGIGVAVPRTVTLYAVPEDVVVIAPDYRSYKYFIVGDKVVIVDPVTYEIVDVLILA